MHIVETTQLVAPCQHELTDTERKNAGVPD